MKARNFLTGRDVSRPYTNRVLFCLVLLSLAACAPKAPTSPTPTPTITHTPRPYPTLPPTWTPTPSFTPAPPSATWTPTPTPTITPTYSAESLCGLLATTQTNLRDGGTIPLNGQISLFVEPILPDHFIYFKAVYTADNHALSGEMPAENTVLLQIPANALSGKGAYTWEWGIRSPQYGDICVHHDTLTVIEAQTPTPTSMTPVAEATSNG